MRIRIPDSIALTAPDLSLVDFEDLVRELARRHDAVVVGVMSEVNDKSTHTRMRYSGAYLVAQGLCYRLLASIEECIRETERQPEET